MVIMVSAKASPRRSQIFSNQVSARRILSPLLILGLSTWTLPGLTTETLIVPPDEATPSPEAEAILPPVVAPSVAPLRSAAPEVALPNASVQTTPQSKNSYIDPSAGTGTASEVTPTVVFSERRSGCRTQIQAASFNHICNTRQASLTPPRLAPLPRYQRLSPRRAVSARSLIARSSRVSPLKPWAPHRYQPYNQAVSANETPAGQVFSLDPILRRGLTIALAPLPEYTSAAKAYVTAPPTANQGTDLTFPVAQSASITSPFGWRVHPISGSARMHQGTDIGAPLGTPVVAAYSGQVAMADWSGGYGLMVVVRHLEGAQESRYAHLSEIFVRPGQEVKQGEIIGRVGSTGYSTGPHLHFEWRHLTPNGWVAVDAGPHLQMALDNLVRTQAIARTAPNSGTAIALQRPQG